jgi:TusA-related sulfurtransferase
MTNETAPTDVLDVKGQSCPMPVVKTKQAIDELSSGALLEVLATDNGSVSDLAGWADGTPGVSLEDQSEREEDGEAVYVHHVRVA